MRQRCATFGARVSTVVTLIGLLVVVGAIPAAAHANLVRSSPADEASVATAPTKVTLTFDENVRMPSVILVQDSDGTSVVRGKTSVVDNTASTRVRLGTSGSYAVVYRVVSADGHPVSGRLSFSVGSPGAGTARTTGQAVAVDRQHESTSKGAPTRVIAMVAALALLGGIGLLTVRRWAPDLWKTS